MRVRLPQMDQGIIERMMFERTRYNMAGMTNEEYYKFLDDEGIYRAI